MKKRFSTKWKASSQPRKQRKYLEKAPLHIKRKFLSVNVTKVLRKNGIKRSIPLRKGDIVKIMRGKFKKKQGKVLEINVKRKRILVEGIQVKKMDGSKVGISQRASNLQVIELNMDDKKRIKNQGKEIIPTKKVETTKEKQHAPEKTKNTK